jgi:hypothetical protein
MPTLYRSGEGKDFRLKPPTDDLKKGMLGL